MRWIVGSSLKFRRLIVALAVGLLIVGLFQLDQTPVEMLPEFNPTVVEVQTEALGLSAGEVEQLITVPLEQDLLNGVAFLDEIESASLPGLSSVVMTFEPGTDLYDARQVVAERLTQVHGLPQVADVPQMLQPLSSTNRALIVRLAPGDLTPIQTSVLAQWVVVPRLLGVDGVANVSIWGQRDRQLQVQVDPERLRAAKVSLQQVIATAGNALEVSPLTFLEASTPGTGGFIENLNQRIQIFHEQTIHTAEELAQVPIEGADETAPGATPPAAAPAQAQAPAGAPPGEAEPLTLGDVTTVVEDHQPLIGDAICDSGPCILLVVEKFPDANTIHVTEGVEKTLAEMRPGLGGMQVDTSVYRPASFTQAAFASLGRTMLLGIALVLLVIAALFRNLRTTVVAAAALALSVAVGAIVLDLRGATVNLMTVAGFVMAVGAVVGDAVADAGGFAQDVRRRRAGGASAASAVVGASLERRRAALVAGLAVAAAMIPFAFMQGEGGAFLPPIAAAWLLAFAVSMLVALVVTPGLAALLMPSARSAESPAAPAEGRHGLWVRRPGRAVLIGAASLAAGLAAVPLLTVDLRPRLSERDLLVTVEAEPGTSLPRMRELVGETVEELGSLPEVRRATAHVGRAIMSDQEVNVNTGSIWVGLTDAPNEAALNRISSVMERIDGVRHTIETYSASRVGEVLGTRQADVVVRVYGEDAEVREAKADEIRARLERIDGIEDPRVQLPPMEPTIEVQVDLDAAREAGVKPGDVRRTAATLFSGITVGNLFEEQKVFDVVVWGVPEIRRTLADLRAMPIGTPDGETVPLGEVAEVQVNPNPTVIRHESVATYTDVVAGADGRPAAAVNADVQEAVRGVAFPLEHHAEVLGALAGVQEARSAVLASSAAAAVSIFLLLQAAFASWRLAALVFLALPVALSGGLVATLATGAPVTLGVVAGLLAVLGMTVRHAVVLVRRWQHLAWKERMPFGPGLVTRGTADEARSIVVTTLAVAATQAPFAFTGGVGLDLIRPLAVTVLGGLVTSSFVTLVLVPALYLKFGSSAQPDTSGEELFVITLPEAERAARSEGTPA